MDPIPQVVCTTSTIADGNMDYRFGTSEEVTKNRRQFLDTIGLTLANAVAMQSPHEDIIVVCTNDHPSPTSSQESLTADALITQTVNQPLLLTTADCIPLTIFDEPQSTIALIHVSRHTFACSLIEKTLQVFREVSSVPAGELRAIIGPHISAHSYRFQLPLKERAAALEPFITERGSYAHIDLCRAACATLLRWGITKEHVVISPIDTATSAQHFSHVRSVQNKIPEGRLLTVTALRA